MQKNITLPPLDAGFDSTMVLQWLVAVGDRVEAEQAIMEIETQKAVSEVPSTASGYVRQLCVDANDTITEGTLLCIVTDTADEPFGDTVPGPNEATDEAPPETAAESAGNSPEPQGREIRALPAVRKLARELGIELASIRGTGAGGQITADDVRAAGVRAAGAGAGAPAARSTAPQGEGWTELPAHRVALNQQMQKSLAEIPQIHISRHMDVSPLMAKATGITFTHKLVQKVGLALVDHAPLRTSIQGSSVKVGPVSVAVAIESRLGLVAPVVRNPEGQSLEAIAETVRAFRERAEAGTLEGRELSDGPFALTNLGMHGVDSFNAFVFHGQTAVLAVGRVDESGRCWFNLAVDHRVVDGAEAARFLGTLQKLILSG